LEGRDQRAKSRLGYRLCRNRGGAAAAIKKTVAKTQGLVPGVRVSKNKYLEHVRGSVSWEAVRGTMKEEPLPIQRKQGRGRMPKNVGETTNQLLTDDPEGGGNSSKGNPRNRSRRARVKPKRSTPASRLSDMYLRVYRHS